MAAYTIDKKALQGAIGFHIAGFIAGTVLFVLLYKTGLFANMILFYRGVVLLAVTSMLVAGILVWGKSYRAGRFYTWRDIALCVVTLFCVNLVFFTHLPVTADRSISVFLLGYLNQHADRAIEPQELTDVFLSTYLYKYEALEKRFAEQLQSGTIARTDTGYQITKKGRMLIQLYGVIADVFGIQKKNITL